MQTQKNYWVKLLILTLVLAFLLIAILFAVRFFWPKQEPFPSSGGEVFAEKVLIDAPLFLQNDARWAQDEIGESGSLMGSEGCAVASVAMLLGFYGIDTDPKRLNSYLTQNAGYNKRGWIYWNKASELSDGKVKFTYAGEGSYNIIDSNLKSGNPVIVKVYINDTIPHWVLVVGKEGQEYLINDPLENSSKPSELSKYNSNIHAVRIYKSSEN